MPRQTPEAGRVARVVKERRLGEKEGEKRKEGKEEEKDRRGDFVKKERRTKSRTERRKDSRSLSKFSLVLFLFVFLIKKQASQA